MSDADHQLDACHCCEGIRGLTPEYHSNRPGLPVLAYRVGTHGTFKATMLARLSRMPALGALGTRADEDLTIALSGCMGNSGRCDDLLYRAQCE